MNLPADFVDSFSYSEFLNLRFVDGNVMGAVGTSTGSHPADRHSSPSAPTVKSSTYQELSPSAQSPVLDEGSHQGATLTVKYVMSSCTIAKLVY